MSLKEFSQKRNKILFISEFGGLGDVIMHRMLFHEVKNLIPDIEIHFSCNHNYTQAVADHACIKKVHSPETYDRNDFFVSYKTCVKTPNIYETKLGKNCKEFRADIWSHMCGVELKDHDMKFNLCAKKNIIYKNKIEKIIEKPDRPIVILSAKSAVSTKSLLPNQIKIIIDYLSDCNVIVIDKKENNDLKKLGIKGIYQTSLEDWIYYTSLADYVVSVDTSTFHLAGGLKKPLLGIFTFANGKTYGKYYDFVLVQKHFENGDWDCGPCYDYNSCCKTKKEIKPCLTEINKEMLETGLREMFSRWPWKPKFSLKVLSDNT